MMQTALLLLPDFGLILLGLILYRAAGFDDIFWRGLERMVYFVLFPALLFYSTATVVLDFASTASFLATGYVALLSGVMLGHLARPVLRPDPMLFASSVQTAFRFNSYIGLAIAGRLGGDAGIALMALLIGASVPLANAAAVYALARHHKSGVLREMARNPLIIATVAGLSWNALGLPLPEPIGLALSRLGNASIALGLIAVGAGLRLSRQVHEPGMVVWFIVVKLLALPAIVWTVAVLLQLSPLQRDIVVMFAALPTASSAYILAIRMGGNGPLVAFLISAGTLVSLFTLPMWLILVR